MRLRTFLLSLILLTAGLSLASSDNLQPPVLIAQSSEVSESTTPISTSKLGLNGQPELPEEVEIQIDPSFYENAVPAEIASESDPVVKRSLYVKAVEWIRKKAPPKLELFLKKFNVPHEIRETITSGISKNLDHAIKTFPVADAKGVSIGAIVYAGVGVSKSISDTFRKKRWGRLIPQREGLGFVFNPGLAFVTLKKAGRQKLIIRLYADTGKVDKMINWMLMTVVGFTGSLVAEDYSEEALENLKRFSYQVRDIRRAHVGPIGAINSAPGFFEHIGTFGPEIPVMGNISFYEFAVKRAEVSFMFDVDFVRKIKQKTVKRCGWLMGPPLKK